MSTQIQALTEDNYEEAVSQVEKLWDAKPDSPEERELYRLSILISRWERAQEPLPPDESEADVETQNQSANAKLETISTDIEPANLKSLLEESDNDRLKALKRQEAIQLVVLYAQDIVDNWPKMTIRTISGMTSKVESLRQALEGVKK